MTCSQHLHLQKPSATVPLTSSPWWEIPGKPISASFPTSKEEYGLLHIPSNPDLSCFGNILDRDSRWCFMGFCPVIMSYEMRLNMASSKHETIMRRIPTLVQVHMRNMLPIFTLKRRLLWNLPREYCLPGAVNPDVKQLWRSSVLCAVILQKAAVWCMLWASLILRSCGFHIRQRWWFLDLIGHRRQCYVLYSTHKLPSLNRMIREILTFLKYIGKTSQMLTFMQNDRNSIKPQHLGVFLSGIRI